MHSVIHWESFCHCQFNCSALLLQQAVSLITSVCLESVLSCQVSIVNSSWTAGHIRQLWWHWRPPSIVFPPCNTTALQQLQLDRKLKRLYLISVAQFRPEKNHRLQLEAFAHARQLALQDSDHGGWSLVHCLITSSMQKSTNAALVCLLLSIKHQRIFHSAFRITTHTLYQCLLPSYVVM